MLALTETILFSSFFKLTERFCWQENEILNDHRRLTVAISRAKRKLVLIGDKSTLKNYAPFARLFSCLTPDQKVSMPSNLDEDANPLWFFNCRKAQKWLVP